MIQFTNKESLLHSIQCLSFYHFYQHRTFFLQCKKSRFIFFNKAGYISRLYDKLIKSRVHNRHKAMVKQATKHVKLVLQHCCETIWIAMFTYYHPHLDLSLKQIKKNKCFSLGYKTRNIAHFLFVLSAKLHISCKVAHFLFVLPYLNKNCKHVLSSELFGGKNMILPNEAEVQENSNIQE